MLKGSRLRESRKKRGLTQGELGNLVGVGKSAICSYEKETRNPSLETIIEFINVLGVSADYLLGTDYIVKSVDNDGKVLYEAMTKEEVLFINDIRKNKMAYEVLFDDPKRGAELIKKYFK